MIDNYLFKLTAKQTRQLKIAMKMFPHLINHYDDFKLDICNTTIDKINDSRQNNLFDVSFINNNTIVKFNGYIIDNRTKYNIAYTFYKDGTAKNVCTMHEHWGYSDIKFMPYTITEGVTLYNDSGRKVYVHMKKSIQYNKTILDYVKGKQKRVVIANDPNRSGNEIIESFHLNNNEYLKVIKNIKNKVLYYLHVNGRDQLINADQFFEKCRVFTSYREKTLIKK